MITDAHGREVLGGGGVLAVDVHALGGELRRLWGEAGDPRGTGSSAVTRACTRNLIVLCPDDDAVRKAASLITGVADRYPSRAFVVRRSDGAPDRLEATLEAQCLRRGDGRHVCCEQITLTVGPAAGRRAASAIVPLLVPDLPVFVWSLGLPDWDDELLLRLLDVADRLLVDSRGCPDASRLLVDLAEHERRDRWSPADFEWARLSAWREAVATLFEDPSRADAPATVARVVIRHGRAGTVAAALLAGWILDRLDAVHAREERGLRGRVESGDGAGEDAAVAIALEPSGGAGGVERVRIELARSPSILEAERTAEGTSLRLRIAGPEAEVLPGHLPCEDASAELLLEDLLAVHNAEPLYENALFRAATLLGGTVPD